MIESMQVPVQMYTDALTQPIIAPVQETLTAKKSYDINDTFIYNGKMYKAVSAITQGSPITIGTNAVDNGNVMDKISGKLLTSSDDLNNIKDVGFYTWGASDAPSNTPISGGSSMVVLAYGNGAIAQIVIRGASQSDPSVYARAYTTSSWTNWTYIVDRSKATIEETASFTTNSQGFITFSQYKIPVLATVEVSGSRFPLMLSLSSGGYPMGRSYIDNTGTALKILAANTAYTVHYRYIPTS